MCRVRIRAGERLMLTNRRGAAAECLALSSPAGWRMLEPQSPGAIHALLGICAGIKRCTTRRLLSGTTIQDLRHHGQAYGICSAAAVNIPVNLLSFVEAKDGQRRVNRKFVAKLVGPRRLQHNAAALTLCSQGNGCD